MVKGMQEYDGDKNYTLRSRVMVFERETENLKNFMYGRCVPVWDYMTDSGGKYSEEKTIGLIEQIANEARYRKMHIWDFDKHEDKLTLYKNLLYCVLRAYTSDYTEYSGGNIFGYGKPEEILFSDILSAFEDSTGELLDGNAVFFMETLYEIFTGKTICLDVLNAEREKTEISSVETEDAPDGKSMEEVLAEELGYNEARFSGNWCYEKARQDASDMMKESNGKMPDGISEAFRKYFEAEADLESEILKQEIRKDVSECEKELRRKEL